MPRPSSSVSVPRAVGEARLSFFNVKLAAIALIGERQANASSAMNVPSDTPTGPDPFADHGIGTQFGRLDADLYRQVRAWMARARLSLTSLKVGDKAPTFLLPDENARLVSSASLLDMGPVVLDFLWGNWSSPCLDKLRVLSAAMLTRRGTVVAITPETGRYPRAMKAQNRLDCVVLSDVDYGVELQFGPICAVPASIVAEMSACGVDLASLHGVAKPMLSAPAVYVISSSGRITYARIDLDFTKAPDPAPVLRALTRG
jgi:peroxiredoxin